MSEKSPLSFEGMEIPDYAGTTIERIYPSKSPAPRQKKKLRALKRSIMEMALTIYQDWPLQIRNRIVKKVSGLDKKSSEKIAIYAHFSSTSTISDMVLLQVSSYATLGFSVVFVSMCETLPVSEISKVAKYCSLVVLRRSFGRDFGAWHDAINLEDVDYSQCTELLLVNDSVLGPFVPLDTIFASIRRFEGVWGLTNSVQNGNHIQSYFVFAKGYDAVTATIKFLLSVSLSTNKQKMVKNGEILFSTYIARTGLPLYSLFGINQIQMALFEDKQQSEQLLNFLNVPPESAQYMARTEGLPFLLARSPVNPTHAYAEKLVCTYQFPFIKTEVLSVNPTAAPIVFSWPRLLTEDSPCSYTLIVDHLSRI